MNNPTEILTSIEEFRRDHPDPKKTAFLIMKFKDDEQYHNIVRCVKEAFLEFDIDLVRADDRQYHDDLFLNVLTYIHGSGMGVAIFDRIDTNEFNPNVSLEVGYMMALSKPICFLKDATLPTLPTDLFGKLYKPFSTFRPDLTINKDVAKWITDKRLDFRCYQCSILVDYNITIRGFNQQFLDELIAGIKLLSPNVQVKLLKVRQSQDMEHTVIDFEANRVFYEHLKDLHENDRLSIVCGCKVLDVSPVEQENPIVSFISHGGHEAFYACHLQYIEGFEKSAQEATRHLTNRTSNIDEIEIFVTYENDFFYYHSNYVKPGFIYVTKIQTLEKNLFNVLKMLTGYFGTNSQSKPTEENLVIAHHFKVKYILDQRAITNNSIVLDYCGTNRIFTVDT